MTPSPTFAELVAEGAAEPVAGWDFSWFEGRATEERPRWGYSGLLRPGCGARGPRILAQGPFVSHAGRFLIEARKPPARRPPG